MSPRRLVVIALSVAGALLLAIVLYVALADLGRHKDQVEAFVTRKLGRAFAIDGAFELKIMPSVSLLAENVRVGNAEWGSAPQMVEVGRFSLNVGFWSLISGPVDIRSFELKDVSVLLERNSVGEANWTFGAAEKQKEETPRYSGVTEVPAVIQHAKLDNVRLTYREPGKPERVAVLETMTIEPGADGLLAVSGNGKVDAYRTKVDGHVGPVDALFSGRNIRMTLQAAIERLQLDIHGSLGRLDPLDGADLTMKVEHPDLGGMLENLRLPVVATGTLDVGVRLKDAGDLSQLDLDAKAGDITAKTNGTLKTLGLPGSDLRFEVSVADAARLAQVFGVPDVPAEAFTASGRVTSSEKEIRFEGLDAKLAGAEVKADGTIRPVGERDANIRFELGADSLLRLRKGLPEIKFAMSGNYLETRDKLELKNVKSRLGATELSGWASVTRDDRRLIEADVTTPRLDLTPFLKKEPESGANAQPTGSASAPATHEKEPPKEPKGKYVFTEEPLGLGEPGASNAKLHFAANEVKLEEGSLKDVDGTMLLDAGQVSFEGRAKGGLGGTLDGVFKLTSTGDKAANMELNLIVKDMRAGLGMGEGIDPSLVPPTNVEAHLRSSGGSARQLAASANGHVLLTQGPGRIKSGMLGAYGSGILSQLAGKLNPFSKEDPFTQLECTVARVDIVDGHATVKPVLMQSEKLTITADGNVDLHTEDLTVDFNTRPREGIGVSPGMFTNPFIKLEGTLASPRIGVGAKGAVSGAVAVATGGISVVAQGLADRAKGEADACKKSLEEAAHPAKQADEQTKAGAKP